MRSLKFFQRSGVAAGPHGRWAAAVAFTLMLAPPAADAQFRYPRPYPGPYGYGMAVPESDLRIAVTPREASVYVDGYLAGTVDDFDGVLQRLHVAPGEHELTIYLEGYRTIRQQLYLSAHTSRKLTFTMEKLAPGAAMEPPPSPREPPPDAGRPAPGDRYPFPRRDVPPPGGRQPRRPEQAPQPPPADSSARIGSIVLSVQPAEADVRIDGEQWRGPARDERLVVQVATGRHRIEVRKDGYMPYSTEVEVAGGASLPVNVSLTRER